jgi:hypothetical protein
MDYINTELRGSAPIGMMEYWVLGKWDIGIMIRFILKAKLMN